MHSNWTLEITKAGLLSTENAQVTVFRMNHKIEHMTSYGKMVLNKGTFIAEEQGKTY